MLNTARESSNTHQDIKEILDRAIVCVIAHWFIHKLYAVSPLSLVISYATVPKGILSLVIDCATVPKGSSL